MASVRAIHLSPIKSLGLMSSRRATVTPDGIAGDRAFVLLDDRGEVATMKVRSLAATLIKQFGVKPDGWELVLPSHPTLGDADTPEALAAYQAAKREHKRQVRAQRERKE